MVDPDVVTALRQLIADADVWISLADNPNRDYDFPEDLRKLSEDARRWREQARASLRRLGMDDA